jgi:hypothetical protein
MSEKRKELKDRDMDKDNASLRREVYKGIEENE